MDSYIFGLIVGMLGGAVILGVLIAVLAKKAGGLNGFSEKNYDERQQRARGIAFKSGFFTMIVYSFLYGVSGMVVKTPWCDTFTGNLLGICLGVTVFAVVSIMKDAYMSLKDNPRKMMVVLGVIGALNLVIAVIRTLDGDKIVENGTLTFACSNYMVVVMFAVIFIATGIKRLLDKKESAE